MDIAQAALRFEKAKIYVLKEAPEVIDVMFNPEEYNLQKGSNFAEINVPGMDSPIIQYISGQQTTLKMTLYFDTYHHYQKSPLVPLAVAMASGIEDVRKYTDKLFDLLYVNGALHVPPQCRFVWGSLSFTGIVKEASQSFTMFLHNGKPVRARMDVTFGSVVSPVFSKKRAPFESPDRTKRRIVESGVQLFHIAQTEYGDPGMWRVIAKENGILNPRKITAGQVLKVPSL